MPASLSSRSSFLLGLATVAFCLPLSAADAVDYSRDIQPILANRCFRCHGTDEGSREAGLRLDLRESAIGEADSGEIAIVPGKPDASELLTRVTHEDEDLRMPPVDGGQALTDKEVSLLRKWIAEGAEYESHWSFTPPQKPILPKVKQEDWVRVPFDRYVLARLEKEGLKPTAEADRTTLIRRLSLHLTGLPPSVAEVDAFVNDTSDDAYEKVVDRLLASDAYGERWARIWLDLARYADSAGYAQDPARTIWRYRDWVIDAINSNLPYDEFTVHQLAGDMLPNATEQQILATAFHRNTMTNSEGGTDDEEFRNAAVTDRVNTTMQVWMGLTMGCAQCHTHKYDPITQEEYFQVFAIFNSTADADRSNEAPTLDIYTPTQLESQKELKRKLAELEGKAAAEIANNQKNNQDAIKHLNGDLKTKFIRVENLGEGVFLSLAEVQAFVGDENVALKGSARQVSTGFNGPAKLAIDGNTSGEYAIEMSTTHTESANNPWWEVELKSSQTLNKIVVWNRTDNNLHTRLAKVRVTLLDAERRPIWVSTHNKAPNPSVTLTPPGKGSELSAAVRNELRGLSSGENGGQYQKEIEKIKKELARIKPIPTPIMKELPESQHRKTHIHLRGSFLDKGKEVQRGVPQAFHPFPKDQSLNRLTFAHWLTAPDNALTARVTVNRYWENMFGIGLVESSEDFGIQGDAPSHPELLDYLAWEFQHNGWDVKALLKEMVMSATYQQSTKVSPEVAANDPSNRLLSRGPRFRLPAEMIRDQALATSGLLSRKMYGPSVRPPQPKLGQRAAFGGSTDWETSAGEDRYRRGLYTSWRRTTPYPSLMTFDAPSREVCTIRRIRTNTPLQALVTLNDPVYVEAAQALGRRMMANGDSPAEIARFGFRLTLSRFPSEVETKRLVRLYEELVKKYSANPEAAKQIATMPLGPLPEGASVSESAAWSVIANVLLNLDETVAPR